MTFIRAVIVFALCVAIVIGFGIGGIELYHLAHKLHPFDYKPFVAAGAFIFFPALALQRGNIGDAFKVVADELPIPKIFGRRAMDNVVVPAAAVSTATFAGKPVPTLGPTTPPNSADTVLSPDLDKP